MRIYLGIMMLVLAGMAAPASADDSDYKATDFEHEVEPKLLAKDSDLNGGVYFDLALEHDAISSAATAYRRHLRLRAEGEGELTLKSGFGTKPLKLDLGVQVAQLLSRPTVAGSDLPDSEEGDVAGFNWGQFNLGISFLLETEQDGDDDYAFGGRLGYLNNNAEGLHWLLPAFSGGYDKVWIGNSASRDALVAPDELNRWSLDAAWATPPIVGGLSAHIDIRYTWDMDQPEAVKEADLDSSQYLAGGLKYTFAKPLLKVWYGMHVMVSDGRIPPITTDETTLHLGFYVFP